MNPIPLILRVLGTPHSVSLLGLAEWDVLVRQARRGNVLASLHALLDRDCLLHHVPHQAREHLEWSSVVAQRHTEAVHWEIRLISRALRQVGIPIVLLKGAAYVHAALPCAGGRVFSDIDILVPKPALASVEAALMLDGYVTTHPDPYDQRYYRTWMHELPPMQHLKRHTVIDVHHALVPETASVWPDPDKLRAAAYSPTSETNLMVLAPADLVLHSAVHLFSGGDFDNGLRDLLDIHLLLCHYGSSPSFWEELVERAEELQLTRSLYYALRYGGRLLGTRIPPSAAIAMETSRPPRALIACMDALFSRVLMPNHTTCTDFLTPCARSLLYIRGNFLRMPPFLLMRHLFHKAIISPRTH